MICRQALARGREMLSGHQDIEEPALESEVLLKHVLQIDRVQLYLNLDKELELEKEKGFFGYIARRLRGEPVAYIIRCREFYGLDFYVDSRVLIPRPETELLVEEAIRFAREHPVAILADIGTGSGAVAISLAVNLQQVKIYATDLSTSALEVAEINCRKHGVSRRVLLRQGEFLEPLPVPVDMLIANLPYVTRAQVALMPSARYEPALALDGGQNGLEKIFQFCSKIKGKLRPGGCVLLEIGMGQEAAVTNFLRELFPAAALETRRDLAGIERVVKTVL